MLFTILKVASSVSFVGIYFYWLHILELYKDSPIPDTPLTRREKLIIWLLCALAPIAGGIWFYYGWVKKLPIKAKQANNISLTTFAIETIPAIITYIFYSIK